MTELFPGVDMVVVNYQTPGDLHRFLQSVKLADIHIPYTLTVVNVSPGMNDVNVVKDWAWGFTFLYVEHEENVGYARACNDAVKYPDREVVAFFNADVEVLPGSVEACYEALVSREERGILGPRQTDRAGYITSAGCFGSNINTSARGWKSRDDGRTYADIRDDAVTVSGSAYFVKRTVWDQLASCELFTKCPEVSELRPEGAFLPTHHYYNETWTSYHARHHGYSVVYYGPVKMIHEWHQSSPVG